MPLTLTVGGGLALASDGPRAAASLRADDILSLGGPWGQVTLKASDARITRSQEEPVPAALAFGSGGGTAAVTRLRALFNAGDATGTAAVELVVLGGSPGGQPPRLAVRATVSGASAPLQLDWLTVLDARVTWPGEDGSAASVVDDRAPVRQQAGGQDGELNAALAACGGMTDEVPAEQMTTTHGMSGKVTAASEAGPFFW